MKDYPKSVSGQATAEYVVVMTALALGLYFAVVGEWGITTDESSTANVMRHRQDSFVMHILNP